MIRNDAELIKETKRYFGRNRDLLKKTVKNLAFDGKRYKEWKKFFKKI